jgi:putative PIN family toxin of toxin-antitoxin system
MKDPPLHVVFDCMLFLQATANRRSPAARALDLLDEGKIKLFVSRPILKEVRDVLSRPEVREQLPGITEESVTALFTRLASQSTLVKPCRAYSLIPEIRKTNRISIWR